MLSESRLVARRGLRISLIAALAPVLAAGAALVGKTSAHADEATQADKAETAEKCAVRLAIALTGKSPDAALLADGDPQSKVDAMVASPEFAERFARFINSEFNGGPIAAANDDPIYYLAKHVIGEGMPWSDLFMGPYQVKPAAVAANGMDVTDDAEGLGYFRTLSWQKRYAGNDPGGLMLVGAFRVMQNTTGLELVPSVGEPDDDRTAEGRKSGVCKGCHYDAWFALDTAAELLPTRTGTGDALKINPPKATTVNLLGKELKDDRELVETLVSSDAWKFNQCREVFKFLYGRPENQCEAATFDACVAALETGKTIQKAVAAVAKDASFCTN
ncbi:MAG: hypothetical protein KIT84_28750 [Labilithrix sp.]|nr:hypothetical protein [Labilithrix sp.]MCW5815050.1 hypothetical protein [Labilithrix sp.]